MSLVAKYLLFALLATGVNLGSQWLVLQINHSELWLLLALFVGTATGLVAKYLLDKRWIFYYQTQGHRDNAHRFSLYTLMGLFTTAIFWGFELGFHYALGTAEAKYIGGAIGLGIGYFIKYQLDKRYVFNS